MKQKVFVVNVEHALQIIDHQANFHGFPSYQWGTLISPEQLKSAISNIKRRQDPYIDVSRLAECYRQFETSKLIARGNAMLKRCFDLTQLKRTTLDAI